MTGIDNHLFRNCIWQEDLIWQQAIVSLTPQFNFTCVFGQPNISVEAAG
jgi:hypothetical protein